MSWLWIFHGAGGGFSSALFSDRLKAEEWIRKYSLTGTLTKMPVDISVYDWAIENGKFKPKRDSQKTGEFIQHFTCGALEHYHYAEGENKTC
jgi:hypothetical protein